MDEAHDPNTQVIMATATLTKAVRTLLADVENGGFMVDFAGKLQSLQSPYY